MDVLGLVVNGFVIAAVGLLLARGERRTMAAVSEMRSDMSEGFRVQQEETRRLERRIDAQSARIDGQADSLGARIDAQADSLGARLDVLSARIDAQADSLGARLDVLSARIDSHVDRHAG